MRLAVLDTTVFKGGTGGNSGVDWGLVQSRIAPLVARGVKVVVPEVVFLELLYGSIREYTALCRRFDGFFSEGSSVEKKVRRRLHDRLGGLRLTLGRMPDVSHAGIIERQYRGLLPFHEPGGERGYRDYLVWMSAVAEKQAQPAATVALISKDKEAFTEDRGLHVDFVGAGVEWYPSPGQCESRWFPSHIDVDAAEVSLESSAPLLERIKPEDLLSFAGSDARGELTGDDVEGLTGWGYQLPISHGVFVYPESIVPVDAWVSGATQVEGDWLFRVPVIFDVMLRGEVAEGQEFAGWSALEGGKVVGNTVLKRVVAVADLQYSLSVDPEDLSLVDVDWYDASASGGYRGLSEAEQARMRNAVERLLTTEIP